MKKFLLGILLSALLMSVLLLSSCFCSCNPSSLFAPTCCVRFVPVLPLLSSLFPAPVIDIEMNKIVRIKIIQVNFHFLPHTPFDLILFFRKVDHFFCMLHFYGQRFFHKHV